MKIRCECCVFLLKAKVKWYASGIKIMYLNDVNQEIPSLCCGLPQMQHHAVDCTHQLWLGSLFTLCLQVLLIHSWNST